MIIEQAEVFSQLTWTIMLAIPGIVALLHVPLAAQWLWARTFGRSLPAA